MAEVAGSKLSKIKIGGIKINYLNYRYYDACELERFPVGTIFQHQLNGRCWISQCQDKIGFLHIENAKIILFDKSTAESIKFSSRKLLMQFVRYPIVVLFCPTDPKKLDAWIGL